MDMHQARTNLPNYHKYFDLQLEFFRNFFKAKFSNKLKNIKRQNNYGLLDHESEKFVGDFAKRRFLWASRFKEKPLF